MKISLQTKTSWSELPEWLARHHSRLSPVGILFDRALEQRIARPLSKSFSKKGFRVELFPIISGESSKALSHVIPLYRKLARAGFDRQSPLIALGGGVVTDLAGFVAATYLRGVPFIQLPTTLLAQVDAAIGGKTGVDLPEGKNLVGSFYHPLTTWIDPSLLKTLPGRHWRNGLAEVIKYGAILDAKLFDQLEKKMDRIVRGVSADSEEWIIRCAQIKAAVVEKDPFERTGLRALLNFGHTVGHAIEGALRYQHLLHGEAISIGMGVASYLSEQLGFLSKSERIRLEQLLTRAGLPLRADRRINRKTLLTFLKRDKKSEAGSVRFVVLKKIGQAESGHVIPFDLLETALDAYGL